MLAFWLSAMSLQTVPEEIRSPDGKIVVRIGFSASGEPGYEVQRESQTVLGSSGLGLKGNGGDFTQNVRLLSISKPTLVRDRYELLTSKRRQNDYRATRRVLRLESSTKTTLDLEFQVSNDGVAFRYVSTRPISVDEERSSFRLPNDAKAWVQPMSVAKTGWSRTNPSYEENYLKGVPATTRPTMGAGWVFPALFQAGDTWVALSETTLPKGYCGSRLQNDGTNYAVAFPDPRERIAEGPVNPTNVLRSPWRVAVIGSLKTVAESTLGTDLADRPVVKLPAKPQPGKAAWSWPLLGDGSANFDTQRKFIDYAAEMKWRYVLIDALWDVQIGYDRVKELIDYARTKGVSILLWYNSNGNWNEAPQTPKDRLTTHDKRLQEFTRLKAMGVAGLKVDFFAGDGASVIDYYRGILEDAAPFGLLMNFHGATLPRGWQRTYPNLMTMESIKGQEFITFDQRNANEQPVHCATIPFTRNLFDPMDFTPVVLDRINRIERRTTSAFELALSVLFTSGIQHYAEIPDGMAKAPAEVRDFLKGVPSVWDEVKFLDGYPGQYAVFARKGEGRWYVSGINGEATPRTLKLNLAELGRRGPGKLIADGPAGNLSFRFDSVKGDTFEITLPPRGGFVIEFLR